MSASKSKSSTTGTTTTTTGTNAKGRNTKLTDFFSKKTTTTTLPSATAGSSSTTGHSDRNGSTSTGTKNTRDRDREGTSASTDNSRKLTSKSQAVATIASSSSVSASIPASSTSTSTSNTNTNTTATAATATAAKASHANHSASPAHSSVPAASSSAMLTRSGARQAEEATRRVTRATAASKGGKGKSTSLSVTGSGSSTNTKPSSALKMSMKKKPSSASTVATKPSSTTKPPSMKSTKKVPTSNSKKRKKEELDGEDSYDEDSGALAHPKTTTNLAPPTPSSSSPSHTPPKRRRISPPQNLITPHTSPGHSLHPSQTSSPGVEEPVPTSDPDELELPGWGTRETSVLTDLPDSGVPDEEEDVGMDVDTADKDEEKGVPPTPVSMPIDDLDNPFIDTTPPTHTHTPTRPLTPPPTDDDAKLAPPTPVALDTRSKTQQLIDQVKAQARAKVQSDPDDDDDDDDGDLSDTPRIDFEDFEFPESDDELPILPSVGEVKPDASDSSMDVDDNPFAESSSRAKRTRYSLRGAPRPSALPDDPAFFSSSSNANGTTKPKKPKKSINPIDLLIKEQQRAAQKGYDRDALQRAEISRNYTTSPESSPPGALGRKTLQDEMEEEDMEALDDDEERDALLVLGRSGSGAGYDRDRDRARSGTRGSESDINKDQCDRLLGEGRGAVIESLLNDAAGRGEVVPKDVGVTLWDGEVIGGGSGEFVLPVYEGSVGDAFVEALSGFVAEKAYTHATMLLNSGCFLGLKKGIASSVISYFCDLALSDVDEPLSLAALSAATQGIKLHAPKAQPISLLEPIVAMLHRQAAFEETLRTVGWHTPKGISQSPSQDKSALLYRLTSLVDAFSRAHLISETEMPDVILALLMIAMDPSSEPDTQTDLAMAVHQVCTRTTQKQDDKGPCSDVEIAICNRILGYAHEMTPTNKACLISLLSMGSGRSLNIARWCAYAFLLDLESISAPCPATPPLDTIQQILTLNTAPESSGKFDLNAQTDYEDMCSWTQVLSVLLTDIGMYLREEKKRGGVQEKEAEKAVTLDEVVVSLEKLHSAIVDTRAAHPDRSKAKENLKRLSTRVWYQKRTALHLLRDEKTGGGPTTMEKFFAKKLNSKQPTVEV